MRATFFVERTRAHLPPPAVTLILTLTLTSDL